MLVLGQWFEEKEKKETAIAGTDVMTKHNISGTDDRLPNLLLFFSR